jgi:hypothetical protein
MVINFDENTAKSWTTLEEDNTAFLLPAPEMVFIILVNKWLLTMATNEESSFLEV